MPVIKQHSARPMVKDAIVLDLGDLGRQAAKLKADAQARAKQILDDAAAEAQRLLEGAAAKGQEEGYAAGHTEGLAKGHEAGRAEALQQLSAQLTELQQQWGAALDQWQAHRDQAERQTRQQVLDFALKVAAKLVHRVVEVDRTVIIGQLAGALDHVLRPLDVTVRIHPDDRPLLHEATPELLGRFKNVTHIELVDDPAITPGGCVLSYGQGEADATIETQLARLVKTMVPDPPAEHVVDDAPKTT